MICAVKLMLNTLVKSTEEQAFEYCAKNWFVLPIKPCSKEPITYLVRNGFKSATTDFRVVESWLKAEPEMNFGISCEMSGLIVIDIDYRNMTRDSWELGKMLSVIDTMIVETGDGMHIYFTTEVLSGVKAKLALGIDIKYKGYVVAPPSVHSNGKRYEANGLEPVALPDYVREWVTK